MAGAKKQTPPPIDRPLSKAYLRQFSGWSTAFPPGQSEPNSVRIMENMMVDRNGAIAVRPGLKYLSYYLSPGGDPLVRDSLGVAPTAKIFVGAPELYYSYDGERALLVAIKSPTTGEVTWETCLFNSPYSVLNALVVAGISIPQGVANTAFQKTTSHVEYVQINNRILALSDDTDTLRMFFVGSKRILKKLKAISVPDWSDAHKLTVYHPDAAWIDKRAKTVRTNIVLNPSFELRQKHWFKSDLCYMGMDEDPLSKYQGKYSMHVSSLPTRTNLQIQPLHDVATTGLEGWVSDPEYGSPSLTADSGYMKVAGGSGLFMAYGTRMRAGVVANQKYKIAVDYTNSTNCSPAAMMHFYASNGARIGAPITIDIPKGSGRFVSEEILTPEGTAAMSMNLGGMASGSGEYARFKNIVVCKATESTDMFHGSSGTDYFWEYPGANRGASVYHPPVDISFWCRNRPIKAGVSLNGQIYSTDSIGANAYELYLRLYDKNMSFTAGTPTTGVFPYNDVNTLHAVRIPVVPADKVAADILVVIKAVNRSQHFWFDSAMIEPEHVIGVSGYFDGSTASTSTVINSWEDPELDHESTSFSTTLIAAPPAISPETPAADTLVATPASANVYKMAFFYTFENEVGESAPSKITEIRVKRPWSNWYWRLPGADGQPTGAETPNDELCADQLACLVPPAVYDRALAEGAIRWNLYGMSWSDQEPVPSVAQLLMRRDLYPDPYSTTTTGLAYEPGGRISITPARRASIDDIELPTLLNRQNFSVPPRHTNGLVAGDHIVLIGSPDDPAGIRWASNRPGEYTNFTANKGGGNKTLSSGNLNLPAAAVLWQNPQSVNTITILCKGDDGDGASHYMAPASVQQGQSGTTMIMGFEETTSTPGSTSPYGAEVLNNGMYRPLDRSLLKSTASNYNISHKPMTNNIANMWERLISKRWIMSAQLDNRLYYLVNNPHGELLLPHCKGNEIWVYDVLPEKGTWSRFLIQGNALQPVKVGTTTYMGVTRPEGLYYLDPESRLDDYVEGVTMLVKQRPIPWRMETNTQGANRAHDAWAHLQQVGIVLGNFKGKMKYGIRGQTINGYRIDIDKSFEDKERFDLEEPVWDVEDHLLIRRDLKEWFFYMRSIDGEESSGHLGYVQYRYTPVTVNVGYEYGSVETFEYGSNDSNGSNDYYRNGIPVPMIDFHRP